MKKIFLILTVLFTLGGCVKNEDIETARPVKYVRIETRENVSEKSFSGLVVSQISIPLSFRVEGNITNQYAKEGDFVKKGQALAKIDPTLYNLEVSENQAKAQKTRIDALNAQSYVKRLESLYKEGAVSARQYDDARANAEALKSQVKADSDRSAYSAQKVSYTTLRAPLDGYITREVRQIGTYVNAGEPVFEFISSKRPEIKAYIPQKYINEIYIGQNAIIAIDALNGRKFQGRVARVNPSSLDTPAFSIRIDIMNPSIDIKDGMSALVDLTLRATSSENTISIPISSVGEDENGNYVWILEDIKEDTAIAVKRKVVIGEINSENVDITSGLENGELVISAGGDFVQEGLKVKIDGNIE